MDTKINDVKTVNHWGKWVSSDTPVTGVLASNRVKWEYIDTEICITCEHIESIEDEDEQLDFIECNSSHTRLLGDWIQDENGLYEPDKSGEFSAIENESTVQVVWSIYTRKGALCSPCYPGQVDIDTPGDFIGYTLPDELYNYED